ncbi:ribonuclease P protein component [Candidatus Dependentiae bacterium]|nr:ribonuclease P protein component [Candidatus Dependentiae bacterium]
MLYKALFSFKQNEVQRAFKRAAFRAKILGLTILQAPLEEAIPHGKLLIVIPRKSGSAVKRNRFRRRAKAIFYEEKLYQKPIISILLVYKEAIDFSFDQIKKLMVEKL